MIALFHAPVAPGKDIVLRKHFKPERLSEEQKMGAIFVETEPEEPAVIKGKIAILYINPETKELWYEYEDRPLTEVELLTDISQKLTELINLQKGL